MLATSVENLDFTVQRIPCVKAFASVATPTALTIDHSEILEAL